jgi:hypothetical protein
MGALDEEYKNHLHETLAKKEFPGLHRGESKEFRLDCPIDLSKDTERLIKSIDIKCRNA